MKKVFVALAVIAFVSSCKKTNEEVPIDPTQAYTIKYDVEKQQVTTKVEGNTLLLNFIQKMNFLVDPVEYGRRWGLHLTQDFSHSYLNGLHFRALANSNGYATDWVPINLNDVYPGQITTQDTVVNDRRYVKVTLNRLFEFSQQFESNAAALAKEAELLNNTSDYISYSAFYSYNDVYSLGNDATVNLYYKKAN